MIDNDKVTMAISETFIKGLDRDSLVFGEIYHNKMIPCTKESVSYFHDGFYAGYAARDKEAEEEKRELIEALFTIYEDENYSNVMYEQGAGFNIHREKEYKLKRIIEKHTGKTIDEVIG